MFYLLGFTAVAIVVCNAFDIVFENSVFGVEPYITQCYYMLVVTLLWHFSGNLSAMV